MATATPTLSRHRPSEKPSLCATVVLAENPAARIVVFDPVPEAQFDVGDYARKKLAFAADPDNRQIDTPLALYRERTDAVVRLLDAIESPNLVRIRPEEFLCRQAEGICLKTSGETVFYRDDNHLSEAGVAPILGAFKRFLDGEI